MENSSGGVLHVLLLEDDEVDIQSVQRTLAKAKRPVQLHIAKNGIEAFDLLYGNHGKRKLDPLPQLIILDINMPKMNGIEFLRKLRADPLFNFINVLILTTSINEQDKIAALNLNISGYIQKPMQPDYFLYYCRILLDDAYDQ